MWTGGDDSAEDTRRLHDADALCSGVPAEIVAAPRFDPEAGRPPSQPRQDRHVRAEFDRQLFPDQQRRGPRPVAAAAAARGLRAWQPDASSPGAGSRSSGKIGDSSESVRLKGSPYALM